MKGLKSIAIFLLIVLNFSVRAQEIIGDILERGDLRVGMTGTQPPYAIESVNGDLIGYEVDLAKMIAENIGVELKIIRMPFSELLPSLKSGKIDIIMSGMTMTPKRNTEVIFLGPYIYSGQSILTQAHIFIEAESAAELNRGSTKITTLAGSTSQKFVEENIPKAKLLPEKDYGACLDQVMKGKADLMLADFSICRYTLLKHPDLGLETFDEPITKEPIGMAIMPGDMLFLNLLRNQLTQFDADGTLEELNDKWFWDDEWISQVK